MSHNPYKVSREKLSFEDRDANTAEAHLNVIRMETKLCRASVNLITYSSAAAERKGNDGVTLSYEKLHNTSPSAVSVNYVFQQYYKVHKAITLF